MVENSVIVVEYSALNPPPSKMKIVSVRTAYHKKKLIVKQSAFKQYVFEAFSYLSSFNIQIRLRNGVENSDHDRIAQK